jgi:predicted nucleotidyltransferase
VDRPYEYADEARLLDVLDRALDVVRPLGVPFLVVGGLASSILGRPRWTRDIDLLFRPEDAAGVLEALERAGFETTVVEAHWLAKAAVGEIVVDVLSRSQPDFLLDDEMLRRAVHVDYKGRELPLASAEDLLVMKSAAASEDTPRYWYDAIALAGRNDLDWDYVVARARMAGARRVLAALLYAQSNDIFVPAGPIETLVDLVLDRQRNAAPGGGR